MSNITIGDQTFATQTGSDAPVLSNFTFSSDSKFAEGRIVQVQHKTFVERLELVIVNYRTRLSIPNFFVDIKPKYADSAFLLHGSLSLGFANTPEWSWYISREISNSETFFDGISQTFEPVGVNPARGQGTGERMWGYHGGPRDYVVNSLPNGAIGFIYECESFQHTVLDRPNTKRYVRYRPNVQNHHQSGSANHININRSDDNGDVGWQTSGSSSLTVWEIAQ